MLFVCQAPVIVRGLGRFLELKERAKQQRQEQKQREEQVFRPNLAYTPRGFTVPQPFKLSKASQKSVQRRRRLFNEQQEKQRQECTFKPQTIEGRHRKVIQNILRA